MSQLIKYKYYDTPEGQDIFMKSIATSKYAALAGLAGATYDILMNNAQPKGFINSAGRVFYFVGPLVGMATAFSVTTNVAQNIRGKNDKLNYFLGGAVAGSIFSAWQRAPVTALPAAVVLGCIAVVKKTAVDAGYVFLPDIPQATKTIKSVKHDWTMVKDIEEMKNFTTGFK